MFATAKVTMARSARPQRFAQSLSTLSLPTGGSSALGGKQVSPIYSLAEKANSILSSQRMAEASTWRMDALDANALGGTQDSMVMERLQQFLGIFGAPIFLSSVLKKKRKKMKKHKLRKRRRKNRFKNRK